MKNNNSGFKEFLLSQAGKVTMIAFFCIVIWGLVALFAGMNSEVIASILLLLLSYFGWKALDKITPNIFLFMPIIGWVIYFIVKFILAFFVGFFVAPFQIAKMITNAIQKNME